METIKGKETYVLTIDWLDDSSTIRQSVDAFESVEEAKKSLNDFDEEAKAWVEVNNPDWVREGDGITFVEYSKPMNSYTSHAVGKITKCVIK